MNYKGIDKAKINEIEKVKLPKINPIFFNWDAMTKSFESLSKAVERYQRKLQDDTEIYIICEMAKKYLDTLDKSIHIGDVVWDAKTDTKGVVIDEGRDNSVLIYTTEGKIYNFEKDKLIKTGEQIDVLNSVWTRKGEE